MAPVEWWGALGNNNGTSGVGKDNTLALTSAVASGAQSLWFAPGGFYRHTGTIVLLRQNFSMHGLDRMTTRVVLDDPTGTKDAFLIDGSTQTIGGITATGIDFKPLSQAYGYVADATVIAGGSGHAVNDVITIPGGTCTTQPQLKVTGVSGGAITAVSVQTPGRCSKRPLQTASMTSFPANAQGATTGAGTGATFDLRTAGPATFHIQDAYLIRIERNALGGAKAWDVVRVEQKSTTSTGKIYISENLMEEMGNNGVTVWGPSSAPENYVGDVQIDGRNYIQKAGHAAAEFRGNIGGTFVTNNLLYANQWGVFWVSSGINGSNKIRHNDIDTNYLGAFLYRFDSSHFQQNWTASGGPLICTLCNGVVSDGNSHVGKGTVGSTMSQLYLNGVVNWAGTGTMFNGVASPVQIGSYKGTPSKAVSLVGSTHAFASGDFASLTDGATVGLTVGVQTDNATSKAVSGSGAKIAVVGQQDATNSVFDPRSTVLWGQQNTVGQSLSAAGGYGNNSNGYANMVFGQGNVATGGFSFVRGWLGNDDGVLGSDCYASGAPDGATAGQAQACQHVLYASSSSTAAKRLTADGGAAGAANCINMPNGSHAQMEIRISGRDTTASGVFADWASTGVSALDRGASAAATTYAGSFSTATAAQASGGAGNTAQAQVSADTANGCLNITVTPPNGNAWRWVATVRRLKMQ
jgi:hypothetical protein